MKSFFVGIPTLRRYDLLDGCIEVLLKGTAVPRRIFVIDNGGGYRSQWTEVVPERPGRNLGVAASWNRLMALAFPTPIVICNDDIEVGPTVMQELLESNADCAAAAGFSCFRLSHDAYHAIGAFDETFWPAYLEESDYSRRLRLERKSLARVGADSVRHRLNSTRKALSCEEKTEFEKCLSRSRAYYLRKWGGLPGNETYLQPFNNHE